MHGARGSLLLLLIFSLPLLSACGARGGRGAGGGTGFPTRPIQIMAPAAPGGGWDQTARAMQAALSKSIGRNAQVYNVPGAGGTVGLAQFVHDHPGDPHQLMVGGLVMLGAIQTNRSPVTLDRVTPIAAITAEWEAIVVPSNSKYQTFGQLIADFKKDPTSIRWGGGSAGGTDHILVGLIARQVGVEPSKINYVAFSGGGEAMTAILSGAVTVGVSSVSESRDQVEAGRLRRLAESSDARIEGMNAPTIKEAGIDVSLANWRALFAPPGLSDERLTAVVDAVAKMHSTEEWNQALKRHGWEDFFKTGDEFSAFLKAERTRVEGVTLQIRRGGYTVVGSGFFPWTVATGLILLGSLFVLRATVFPDRGLADHVADESRETHWPTVALTAMALLAYAFALGPLGYIVATAAFIPAVARILGSRRTARDLLLGIALSVAIYVVFTRLLEVRLPGGVLGRLLSAMS
jgi:putative tricarboxylic transport membrane protein